MSPRTYLKLLPVDGFDRQRQSAFSYECNACSRCCYDKVIRVGPFETLLLARHLNLSTTELLTRYTEAGGTVLRANEDHSCVFLRDGKCSVHPARPLSCRLYPLTWHVDADGSESFGVLAGHPESAGHLGNAGTVDAFCQAQGVQPYLDMVRRYIRVHDHLLRALQKAADPSRDAPHADALQDSRNGINRMQSGALASPWLDVHKVVLQFIAKHGGAPPTEVLDWIELHIRAIEAGLTPREPDSDSDSG